MRYELSDYEWTAIKLMQLPNNPRGVQRAKTVASFKGTFWVLLQVRHGAT